MPTFKMTKAGMFYYDLRHLLKNMDADIMVNDSHETTRQVQDKNKIYHACDIKRADCAKLFQHITGKTTK